MNPHHNISSRSHLVPYLAGAGAIACWASLAAAIGKSLQVLAPEAVLFWGLLVAGLSLWAWDALQASIRGRTGSRVEVGQRGGVGVIRWPGWRVALFGVYGIWGYHTLLVLALAHAPPVAANIINYTWTLWIVVLGSLQPGYRLTPLIALAGLSGFAGVVVVIGGETLFGEGPGLSWLTGNDAVTWNKGPWIGFALALAASGVWSSFTVYMHRIVPPGERHMALFCLLSAAVALVFLLARGVSPTLPLQYAPMVIYLGLVPLGLSFVLWEAAAHRAQLQILGLMSFFTPLLSTWVLALVTGQPVGRTLYAGLACILLGAALGSRALKKQRSG